VVRDAFLPLGVRVVHAAQSAKKSFGNKRVVDPKAVALRAEPGVLPGRAAEVTPRVSEADFFKSFEVVCGDESRSRFVDSVLPRVQVTDD
jgi:hypothetical protein